MYQFAIIGCGHIAASHAENIIKKGKLVAVCDTDKVKADAFALQFDAKPYYKLEDVLKNEKDVQIICVCTPSGFHAEHCIKALQAGKDVLCESPMCLTTAAAWQMIETEKFCRQKLFVVKPIAFNDVLQKTKALIQNEDLGVIYSFQMTLFSNHPKAYFNSWHGKLFPAGGTLFSEFNEHIDALLYLFGDITKIKGMAGNYGHQHIINIEDTGFVSLRMQDGVVGGLNWWVNNNVNSNETALTIVAEKGTICIGGKNLDEIRYQHLNVELEVNEKGHSADVYESVFDHLIQALDKREGFATAFDGLQMVQTIEKIYKAVGLPAYHSV